MKTVEQIRDEIEALKPAAAADEESLDREIARAVLTALQWVLADGNYLAPRDTIGWVTMRFTREALEVIRFAKKEDGRPD